MTAPELDEPRMIWTGPLPSHLQRAEAPSEEPWFEPRAEARPIPHSALTAAAAGLALVVGIAIGAFVPPALRVGHAPTPRPAAVVRAPANAVATPAEPPPLAAAEPPVAELQPATPAPRAALAMLAPAPKALAAQPSVAKPAPSPCAGGSRADRTVCADVQVAAADRDLKLAYQRALAAGAPASALHADQIDWLLVREDAARRSPAELALAYRQRIDQLNSLADEPPH